MGVDDRGLAQQRPHFSLQLPLGLEHPHVAHRLVLAGIAFVLGAIQCHHPQGSLPCLVTQLHHLNEQSGQRIKMSLKEIDDLAVVRLLVT